MKFADRVVLIYGVSVVGSAIVSYLRGKEMTDILFDAAVHGAIVGTGLNVVGYIVLGDGSEVPVLSNPDFEGMGNVRPEGVALLEEVNSEDIYQPMKKNGVKVAPIPENPSIVLQDRD